MLRVFGVGRGGDQQAPADRSTDNSATKTRDPGELRLQKEISELELPSCCNVSFVDQDSLLQFVVSICPEEGYWQQARLLFGFTIPHTYPHDPPKVKCTTRIYHPNVDLEGNVCLNILREDWRPVLSISTIVMGLLHLLLEPNANDPLNQEAAALLRRDPREFGRQVSARLKGGTFGTTYFERLVS